MSIWTVQWADIVNAAATAAQALLVNNQNIGQIKNAYFNSCPTTNLNGGTVNVDLSAAQNNILSLSATTTVTFTAPAGCSHGTFIVNSSGTFTITWPTGKKPTGGITLNNSGTTIVSWFYDGSAYYFSSGLAVS